jgi:predicted ester cyclase
MSEQNRTLATRWMIEVWNDRNDATLHELLDPQVEGYFEGIGRTDFAGFVAARKVLLDTFPELQVTVEDLVADGDRVVLRWKVDAKHGASGQTTKFRGMTWMIFKDGRIVRGWDAWNQGALAQELKAPAAAAVG